MPPAAAADASTPDGSSGDGQGLIVNADDRGGTGPNGKPSLGPIDAGAQITRTNTRWGAGGMGTAATVTFAFRSTAAVMPEDTAGFTRFTDIQIAATLLALAAWSDVANITFTRVDDVSSNYSNNATILFANYSSGADGAAAFAYLPGNSTGGGAGFTQVQGDVWTNSSQGNNVNPAAGNYGQLTLIHEIGHAIGLSHPAAYNAGAGVSITYSAHATYFEDSNQYTVMSYFRETNTGASFGGGRYAASAMMDDIAAAQRLYGANTTTRTGDTVYGFNSNAVQPWYLASSSATALIFAVWDAGGIDTLDFSGYSQTQTIDLRQGAFSSVGGLTGNVGIAMGAVIENAIGGSGNDTIRGNSGDNRIRGAAGNDTIDGGLGSDTAVFTGLRSAYTITWNGQTATVTGPNGTDTITNVEFFAFDDVTIPAAPPAGGVMVGGDVTNETINGTAFADTIGGLGGNDTVNGLDGADTLNGGNGTDVADYTGAGAAITANLGTNTVTGAAGTDTLSSIEEVRGTTYNDTLIGSSGNNILRGGGGTDMISGAGGDDFLYAGAPALSAAPDVIKPQSTVNNSVGTAVSLNGTFDLMSNPNIALSTFTPHSTVLGTTHGGYEFYSVSLIAGDTLTLDVDGASFDTVITIVDAAGNVLATNDDANTPDGGNSTDSQLDFTVFAATTVYIRVGQWTQTNADSPPTAGGTYTLHVSVPSQTPVPIQLLGSTLNGDAGADVLFGGTGVDVLNGGDDNDVLLGGAGNDAISGGNGYDIAGYSGVRRGYSSASATSVSGGVEGGTDTLTGIEDLAFTDGRLTFARDGQAAQVMRLYDAAFNRAPDQSGFEALLDTLENGSLTLQQLANEFITSTEFQSQYAGLTNQQFVEQLYQFCLNRAGDSGGVTTWVNALNGGMTRGEVLLAFSESGEHKDILQGQLDQGLWVADEQTLMIARLYDATYDRLPDQAGLKTWRDALGGGMSLIAIAQAFATAPEFQARYGSLSNQQFVELMYQLCLNRNGDAGGIQTWVDALNGGMSRGEVLYNFSESSEHVALTRPTWLGGVRCTDTTGNNAAPQVLPGEHDGPDAKHDGPQVLPAVTDNHDGHEAKDAGAQVLPGAVIHAGRDGDVMADASSDTGAQILPAVVEDSHDAKGETGAQVLPAVAADDAGKEDGAQVLPGTVTADGSDAKAAPTDQPLVLPGMADDAFLLDKAVLHEDGPQVLPGVDGEVFTYDPALTDGALPRGGGLTGLDAREALLFLADDHGAKDHNAGAPDHWSPLHDADPWAA